MSSNPSETSSPSTEAIEDVISSHGKSIPPMAETSELALRLDKVESLIEELGKRNELIQNFADYIGDLKGDLNALRQTRFWLLLLAVAFVVGTDVVVLFMVFHHGKWFAQQDTYFKSVMFLGTLTASVVLISIMIKGAFHSLAERIKDDDGLPPHIKEGMDLIKTVVGK